MIQICSGITGGRVSNGELYVQRVHKCNFAPRIEEKSS